jgi:WD40 repeat protein
MWSNINAFRVRYTSESEERPMREYVGPPRQPWHVAFVPGDPPRLAAVDNQAAYLWRLDRPDPAVLTWEEPPAWGEPLLSPSPDGRWLAAGTNVLLALWDLDADPPDGPVSRRVPGAMFARFAASPAELLVVSTVGGGDSFQVRAGSLPVAEPKAKSPGRAAVLPLVGDLPTRVERMTASDWRIQTDLSADGARLAIVPRERAGDPLAREAFIWDVGTGKPPRRVEASGHPGALSFSPDGSRLVIDVGTIYVHDTATTEVIGSWKAKRSDAPRLAWSPDGKLLARTDNSTTVRVYDAATGRQVMAVGGKRGRLVCAAFAPDGLTLATATNTGPIRVWDVE